MEPQGVNVVTTKLPSYLKVLLQEDFNIKLVYREKKKAEIFHPSKNCSAEISNESTELELIGNPLEVDLGNDESVCSELTLQKPPSWAPEETFHGPLSLTEARAFINARLKAKSETQSLFCVCDGADIQHTVCLGAIFAPKRMCRYLVHILPCCPENSEVTKLEHMKNDHLKSVRSNAKIKTSCTTRYSIFGYDLKNCSFLSKAEYNGNISLELFWSDDKIFQHNSDATMNLQVIVGHNSSPLSAFWEELCFIQACIKKLENEKALDDSTVINADNGLDCMEITSMMTNFANMVGTFKRNVRKNLDLNNVRQLNILDKLWNVLKHARTISDLRFCFHFFFEELAVQQRNMHVLKEDKSAIGEIVNGIVEGRIAVPTLSLSQSLELLIDLGLEKLKNDYVAMLTFMYGIVKDSVFKNWRDLSWENSQISASRSTQRRTKISINPKASMTDLTSNKLKFSYLDSLHKTAEFVFLYKQNLPQVEGSFDCFCERLCNQFTVQFQDVQCADVEQPRLCHFSCSISSTDANLFIKNGTPVATITKLTSDIVSAQVTTIFHLSDYPIIPPSIFEDYDTEDIDGKILYVSKLVKYAYNC